MPPLAAMFDAVPAAVRARSAPCIPCHAPRENAPIASGSAAALWVGRGGVDPETGAPLVGPAPHLSIQAGCVGCHREGPEGVERGRNHGFRADRSRCTSCHDAKLADGWAAEKVDIEKEARELWISLLAARTLRQSTDESANLGRAGATGMPGVEEPRHATTVLREDASPSLRGAAFDLSLLLEDRGFVAHNLPYARLLIEKAKKAIARVPHGARPDNGGGR
jgi:hypothetical protein